MRNLPFWYWMLVIVPAIGERFRCTSSGERKILPKTQLPVRHQVYQCHASVGGRNNNPWLSRNLPARIAKEESHNAASAKKTEAIGQ